MSPWRLYDDLIDGLPAGITVRAAVRSHFAAVRTSANTVGIAMADSGGRRAEQAPDVLGVDLRSVAALVKSWDFGLASLGVAALNAWYNTEEQVRNAAVDLVARDEDGFLSHAERVAGKTVGMVGHFAGVQHFSQAARLVVLEREPRPGDYPDPACEYELPGCDEVFITGTALTNKTMPRLLELSARARTVLVGPTTPFAPLAFDGLVQEIDSSWVNDPDGCWELVCLGAPMRYLRQVLTRFNAVLDHGG